MSNCKECNTIKCCSVFLGICSLLPHGGSNECGVWRFVPSLWLQGFT